MNVYLKLLPQSLGVFNPYIGIEQVGFIHPSLRKSFIRASKKIYYGLYTLKHTKDPDKEYTKTHIDFYTQTDGWVPHRVTFDEFLSKVTK